MKTARERAELLARAFPRLFPHAALLRLLREQLGSVDALDKMIRRGSTRIQARAPRLIYHICAGNLSISAVTSIVHGLLLGARNEVKLPGEREDASTRKEILDFVGHLPAPLRRLVSYHCTFNESLLRCADAVIAFGGDSAMAALREKVRWNQIFSSHGHAVSLLWIAEPDRLTSRKARACAIDILTYDQLGCLSPQAVYLPRGSNLELLGRKLSVALEKEWHGSNPKPRRALGIAARVAEARDVAMASGHRVWLPPQRHLGWTIIHDPNPLFAASPLHGIIYLRESNAERLSAHLTSVRGRISTVGFVAGKSSSRWREAFLSLGVSRFCPAGRMQFPPLTWHHDGRQTLADLVTWIDFEDAS